MIMKISREINLGKRVDIYLKSPIGELVCVKIKFGLIEKVIHYSSIGIQENIVSILDYLKDKELLMHRGYDLYMQEDYMMICQLDESNIDRFPNKIKIMGQYDIFLYNINSDKDRLINKIKYYLDNNKEICINDNLRGVIFFNHKDKLLVKKNNEFNECTKEEIVNYLNSLEEFTIKSYYINDNEFGIIFR